MENSFFKKREKWGKGEQSELWAASALNRSDEKIVKRVAVNKVFNGGSFLSWGRLLNYFRRAFCTLPLNDFNKLTIRAGLVYSSDEEF